MSIKPILVLISVVLATGAAGQAAPAAVGQQAPPPMLEPVQGGWQEGSQRPVAQEEKKELSATSLHVGQEFLQMRIERNEALARSKGRLAPADRDQLQRQAEKIADDAPNSFEAHMAAFYAAFPATASFQHLDRAHMRDPNRPELIGPRLADAARRNNPNDLAQWSRAMRERLGVAQALLQYATDLLASVDRDGVLIAAGEMDAYPAWTLQQVDGARRDVLVVDQRLLVDPAYRQRIWDKTRARGQVPQEKDFVKALASATDRPLHLSSALGRDNMPLPKEELYVVGLALRHGHTPVDNIALLEQRWKQMNKTIEAGPLSRNYLLPGVVLMMHYRTIQDETRASLMEHEVRQMARHLNATRELYEVLDEPAPPRRSRRPPTH